MKYSPIFMPKWNGLCAICNKKVEQKDFGGIGQKSNDREASIKTFIYGHKKCIAPIGKELLEYRGDLRN